jgi:hypothetical protein
METYLDLREKIEDRIEDIENYYELNFDKPNSQYFEKGRMKLKKLLMFEPSSISEMKMSVNDKQNLALIVNETNKNTIESNYNNNINFDDNKDDLLNKVYHNNIQQKKKVKMKFIPLKEKKWKKTHSVEKLKSFKDMEEINNKEYIDINKIKYDDKKKNIIKKNNKKDEKEDGRNENNKDHCCILKWKGMIKKKNFWNFQIIIKQNLQEFMEFLEDNNLIYLYNNIN